MRFATIAALGALAVVKADDWVVNPDTGMLEFKPSPLFDLPTELVDEKCYGNAMLTSGLT